MSLAMFFQMALLAGGTGSTFFQIVTGDTASDLPGSVHHRSQGDSKPQCTVAFWAAEQTEDRRTAPVESHPPEKHHEYLKPLAGSWECKITTWDSPGQTPMEGRGTIQRKMILGGRFVQEEFVGMVAGSSITGIGFMGYDTLKKKYVTTWLDSMNTSIANCIGDCDASGKVFTMLSVEVNPMTQAKDKQVLRVLNNDKTHFEILVAEKGGKEFKSLEMECSRK